MAAHEDATRAAQQLLASLALDDDTYVYLCKGLEDGLVLEDEEGLRGFLEPFLPVDALENIILLQSSLTESCTENITRKDVKMVPSQSSQATSMCIVEEDVADVAFQDGTVTTQTTRASVARRKHQPKGKQMRKDGIVETSYCEVDVSDKIDAETAVLNARSVRVGHYIMINSRPYRVEKVMGTQKSWKGNVTGCFKTHFIARCIFTGKKTEHLCLATDDLLIASVQNLECTVMDVGNAGELTLLHELVEKTDVNLPTETVGDRKLAERVKRDFDNGNTVVVRVMASGGSQKVVEVIEHKCTD